MEELIEQINEISLLSENWDGYNAIPVLPEIIEKTKQFINYLPKDVINKVTDIYPNPNGTISIDFENNNDKLGLEIGKTSASYFIRKNGKYFGYDNVNIFNIDELNKIEKEVINL